MLTVEHLPLPPDNFLSSEAEGYAYYKAFQESGIENFEFGYFAVKRNETTVAVVPYFVTQYYLNTTLENGRLKRLLGWLSFRIACVGHPSADFGMIDGEMSEEVLQAINTELFKLAPVVAYKDFGEDLPLRGFSRESNLPIARLDIKGDFYSGLRGSTRREFRQRLRKARSLRIEERDTYPREHAERIYELYSETFNRAQMVFEKLTPQFFETVAPISKYVLYWEGDTLIGFALLICKGSFMLGKYLGMDYATSRKYGLYFVMMLNHIEICIRDGYSIYQTGQSSYDFKKRLGSTMIPTYIYFRHRHSVTNRLLSILMRIVSYSERVSSTTLGWQGFDAVLLHQQRCVNLL